MIRVAEANPPTAEIRLLQLFLSEWQYYGPGVFGADLGKFVQQSEQRRTVILRVLMDASNLIDRYGDQIPVEYLCSAQLSSGRAFTGDYPVARAKKALHQIRELLD